jgi:hypothetical protein
MVKLILPGEQEYRVINKSKVNLKGYSNLNFIPTRDFISEFERMYEMKFNNTQSYPYLRKDMNANSKLLVPPITNDVEDLGIVPIFKDDIYLSFSFSKEDIKNSNDLKIGIEEILLAHHKNWMEKRRRQGRR